MRTPSRHRSSLAVRLLLTATPLALAGASLAGCGEPIDPTGLADQAALRAREIVHQSGGGVSFAAADDSGLQRLGAGTSDTASGVAGMMPSPVPPGMMSAMAGGAMAMAAAGMPSLMSTEEQFDDTADRLRVFLRERILADANLESRGDDEAVYLLHPEPTCRSIPDPQAPDPTAVPALDQDCADKLTRLPVRVAMREDGDGVRLTVLVGAERLALSAFIVHSDLLAVETDFAQAHAASEVIDRTLGSDTPMPAPYETLVGRTRLALRKLGERKVSASVSVLEAVHIATLETDGAPGPEVKLGVQDPMLAVTADGVAQTLALQIGVRDLDVRGDWDPRGLGAPNRDLHVAIPGLTGTLTFSEASDEIRGVGLGVQDVAVDVRDARIFELGLNPADTHHFDLRVTADAADQAQFEITPRFDLSLGFHLGLVAADLTSAPASYVDEVYGVRLDNGGAPAIVQGVAATGTFSGGVKIGAGTLTLSSNKVATPVVVPAGKCLTSVDPVPAGAHPILGAVAAVDCP